MEGGFLREQRSLRRACIPQGGTDGNDALGFLKEVCGRGAVSSNQRLFRTSQEGIVTVHAGAHGNGVGLRSWAQNAGETHSERYQRDKSDENDDQFHLARFEQLGCRAMSGKTRVFIRHSQSFMLSGRADAQAEGSAYHETDVFLRIIFSLGSGRCVVARMSPVARSKS